MITLFLIILSALIASLISFVGAIALVLKENILNKTLTYLISLSIGGLMGGAFLHLLPEAIEKFDNNYVFLAVLIGFFLFLVVEKGIHWRHCHNTRCQIHSFAYTNLLGDAIHNFIDGLIIAGAFLASPALGITSTVAIIMHEIPQEIGDFGVLIYAGMRKKTALLMNFFTALLAIVGSIVGFYFLSAVESFSGPLLALAAGGFLYIAAADLIPEIKKEPSIKKSLLNLGIIFLGILLMYLLKLFEG